MLFVLLACAPDPVGGPTIPFEPTVTPTPVPGPTHPDWSEIPPTTRILGLPPSADGIWFDLGTHPLTVLPAYGDQPGTLLLRASSGMEGIAEWADLPHTFFVPGDLGPGDHSILDVYQGGLDLSVGSDDLFTAGDTDRDGHPDLWLGGWLVRGPLLGRDVGLANVVAKVGANFSAGVGDFDSDGDGELDVLVGTGIHYGPFVGDRPEWPNDPEVTTIEVACTPYAARLLPDLGGPEQDAFALIGATGFYDECFPDTVVYPLYGPRGRQMQVGETWSRGIVGHDRTLESAGDLDGDGDGDVVYNNAYLAPLAPELLDGPLALDLGWGPLAAVGDVDGDGTIDFLARIGTQEPWHVLLLSPVPPVVELDHVIPIAPVAYVSGLGSDCCGAHYGDVDGDGRSDLVAASFGEDRQGIVSIWTAADLLAGR